MIAAAMTAEKCLYDSVSRLWLLSAKTSVSWIATSHARPPVSYKKRHYLTSDIRISHLSQPLSLIYPSILLLFLYDPLLSVFSYPLLLLWNFLSLGRCTHKCTYFDNDIRESTHNRKERWNKATWGGGLVREGRKIKLDQEMRGKSKREDEDRRKKKRGTEKEVLSKPYPPAFQLQQGRIAPPRWLQSAERARRMMGKLVQPVLSPSFILSIVPSLPVSLPFAFNPLSLPPSLPSCLCLAFLYFYPSPSLSLFVYHHSPWALFNEIWSLSFEVRFKGATIHDPHYQWRMRASQARSTQCMLG